MKNRMKKILGLLLASSMTLAMLSGCGSSDDKTADNSAPAKSESTTEAGGSAAAESTDTASEKKTFTMFAGVGSMEWDYNENPAFLWACDKTNVYFDITHVATSDTAEKGNLLLNSGDYPDVFFKTYIDVDTYGMEEILIPLEDLIREYMPNLTAILDADDGWKHVQSADGHIYTLPEIQGVTPMNTRLFINGDWLDTLGLDMPTDLDSLYEVLKAFKEKDPNGNGIADEIPLATSTFPSITLLLQHFGYNYQNYYAVDDNGELYFLANTDGYYEFLEYITKLYSEGLINQDCFTFDWSGLQPKATAGEDIIVGMFWDFQPVGFVPKGATSSEGEGIYAFDMLMPFTEGTLPLSHGYVKAGILCITDACEDPGAVLAWADQYYTDEGAVVALYGVEGETWEWNDDGTWAELKDEEGNSLVTGATRIQGDAYHPAKYPTEEFESKNAGYDKFDAQLAELISMGAEPWPTLSYTEEENEERSTLKTDIRDYVFQYLSKVVVGEYNLEETWDEYLKTLDDMGLERLTEIECAAYNRAVGKE